MKPSLQLRISQQISMTPQLQQAIRLLQLSTLELKEEIQNAVESNLMLEAEEETTFSVNEPVNKDLNTQADSEKTNNSEQMDTWSDILNRAPRTLSGQNAYDGYDFERAAPIENTLQEHLTWQMQLTPFSTDDRLIATALIDAINDEGYLKSTLEDIYQTVKDQTESEIEIEDVLTVLHHLQQFEPLGVGARDLSECLAVQLRQLPPSVPFKQKAIELVLGYLPLLAKQDYAKLCRHLRLTLDELKTVIKYIQMQNPRPGSAIGASTSEYIVPDVYVRKQSNRWIVTLNKGSIPSLKINDQYAGFIRRADSSRDNQFLKQQLQEAKWLLQSIENRNETLLKVAECIVNTQTDFFEYGPVAMKPLILNQVAEKINMHESTISRVTNQKFMHTPKGIFELKYFFSSYIRTLEGEACSATSIQAHIKKLISTENQKKPLSDDKLAQLLSKEGIKIARRTVSKYREAMTIPSSHERKKLF